MIIEHSLTPLTKETFKNSSAFGSSNTEGIENNGGAYYQDCGGNCVWFDAPSKPSTFSAGGGAQLSISPCGTTNKVSCPHSVCAMENSNGYKDVGIAFFTQTSALDLDSPNSCRNQLETTSVSTDTIYKPTSATGVCVSSEATDKTAFNHTGTYENAEANKCGAFFLYKEKITLHPGYGIFLSEKSKKMNYSDCGGKNQSADINLLVPASSGLFCPAEYNGECDGAYMFEKNGSYIYSTTNLGNFSTFSFSALSDNPEVSVKTEEKKYDSGQTFSYTNDQVVLTQLENNSSKTVYTNVYNAGTAITTYTYDYNIVERTLGTDTLEIFKSESVTGATYTKEQDITPLCNTGDGQTQTITLTKFVGETYSSKAFFVSTTQLGQYYAYQPTTTKRLYALQVQDFDWSTSVSNKGSYSEDLGPGTAECFEATSSVGQAEYTKFVEYGKVIGNVPIPKAKTIIKSEDGGTYAAGAVGNPPNPDPISYTLNCNADCKASSSQCVEQQTVGPIISSTSCQAPPFTYVATDGFGVVNTPIYESTSEGTFSTTVQVDGQKTVSREVTARATCTATSSYSYAQSVSHLAVESTVTNQFQGKVYRVADVEDGILFLDSKGSTKLASTFSLVDKQSMIDSSDVMLAFDGIRYSPFAGKTTMISKGDKTTYIAMAAYQNTRTGSASSASAIHSYYESWSGTGSKGGHPWEKASWDGYGVVHGRIKTGEFEISFSSGKYKNKKADLENSAAYRPGEKVTIVADGGLNFIKSKQKSTESSFITTSSTNAFSTSFDSSFDGAYSVSNIPFTFATTAYRLTGWNGQIDLPILEEVVSCCSGVDSPAWMPPSPEASPLAYIPGGRLIASSSTYFERGDLAAVPKEVAIYQRNRMSYLWTNPASTLAWGTGHQGSCG